MNNCEPINHAVVIVGFNKTSECDNIIIKNLKDQMGLRRIFKVTFLGN